MNARNLIGGFIAGAALGVAAGLLMAPYSGAKARRKIVSGSKKIKRNVVDYVENSLDGIRSQFNDRIDRLAKRGKETINHASEKVKM
ncbi:MAG TPA: YtxH domain-containing protein [Cyclobacteriaceae bacterium]|nr:YtxH domain-containing protein [Cyclobacteriaceae bacterium]